ncbi:MAG: hypothetical protein K2J20_01825, partial [Bacilli bacterium]|nr:hypothetical protein [Bacilli bacterium]
EDLLAKIERTSILNSIITTLEENITKYTKELENLKKISMLELVTKDLIDEEHDKEKLKEVTEEIKAIKNRQKFDKTPDEIYDQIDMQLASFKSDFKEPVVKDLDMDNLFEVEEILHQEEKKIEPERLKVIDMIPVETVRETSTATEVGGN